ncbi:hypothetical protein P775_18735 [Puniceibacterium antarcticum]|uniref:Regulatory protein n=1 Tax=Puniceibacterium antarcticum TaxID=1206336 RepID=A0A2G8RAP8_9RHOB|nr:thioredoxin family protein [Puniceibacterium antarcticum]PIL18609.1 hypothetical protein P775_18735 [Puniceibacterium antarcticum]
MSRIIASLAAVLALWTGSASADPTLIMVQQPGCVHCAMWDKAIAPIYPKTPEGQFAPLVRAELRAGPPEGISYARKVTFTPTFILIDDGQEQARIEGYPGEDFFWGLLGKILQDHTDFTPGAS